MCKKKFLSCLLAATVSLGCFGTVYDAEAASRSEIAAVRVNAPRDFRYWSKDSVPKQQIIDYVRDVTDKDSKNYIPEADRIAVFDCDGTLMCETAPYYFDWMLCLYRMQQDPTFKPTAYEQEFAVAVNKAIHSGTVTDEMDQEKNARIFPGIFYGFTPEKYHDYVTNYMNSTYVEGLSNLKTGEAFYLPMVEVMSYLANNNFKVYVVSGCEREILRALLQDIMPVPPDRIIGSDHSYRMKKQPDDVPDDVYQWAKGDELIRGNKLFSTINVKGSKVIHIQREIGQKPVLAFGNSSGDASMFDYTITNNKYKAAAFTLLCDDTKRELGNEKKAAQMKQAAKEHGWHTISMRDDFQTIYGDNVKRTK